MITLLKTSLFADELRLNEEVRGRIAQLPVFDLRESPFAVFFSHRPALGLSFTNAVVIATGYKKKKS